MVPHDCSGAERNHTAGLLKSPAKIDVVTGFVVFDIEAADVFEGPPVERHVTTWNVFGDGVGEQNVAGTTRCRRHTSLDPILRRGCDVRPAHARIIAAHEHAD